jgi:hypothetical protein
MRRIPRTTWISIVVIGLLTMLGSVTGSIGANALTWLSPQVALVLFALISLSLIGFSLWQERQKAASEPSAAEASENRQIMLGRVKNKWITGFLENPLYYSYDEQLLPLPLRERVGSRFDLVLSNPHEPAQPIPPGTTLAQVFDQAGGELLIMGEPGAGKTTLLLELVRDLLKRAKDDEEAPIPVVLMLASWATRKLPLEQWIAEELKEKYDIPSQIGEAWVKANQLLLLLDGLDEVAPSALPACIEAINEYYHQGHPSLVVCSRTKEFLDQPGRLALHTAVIVQLLASEQVDTYLDGLAAKGEDVEGLKHGLHQSAELLALATTPLFLTVLILAYHGKPAQEILALVETVPTDQQHLLFHSYVEQVLQRKGTHLHASAQQTKHWLAWLARQMVAHDQSELYLEQFQPDWLPKSQRAFYQWSVGLLGGLSVGLSRGLLIGLGAGLLLGKGYGLMEIKPVPLIWSRDMAGDGLVFGLFGGLFVGLIGGLLFGLVSGLFGGLLFGLFIGLLLGYPLEQLTERSMLSPNEGIHRSLKNGLFVGLLVGLLSGLFIGLGGWLFSWPEDGLLSGLVFGLFVGLLGGLLGLLAAMLHYTLRFWLWQAKCTPAPWEYVAFLDDTVEQLLLRKVGGGYIFRHRLLQDYFASLDVVPPHDPSFRAEARSVLQHAPNGDPSL